MFLFVSISHRWQLQLNNCSCTGSLKHSPGTNKRRRHARYTNLRCMYTDDCVKILPLFGSSDYSVVSIKCLNHVSHLFLKPKVVTVRHRTQSNKRSFRCYLSHVPWQYLFMLSDIQLIFDVFYFIFNLGLDSFIPYNTYRFFNLSKPWFNAKLKDLHSTERMVS